MSVCCFKRTPHSASRQKKNHIWGNIQSLWQDVKYYFIFLISFLDVNIVVNTNLYLNITVCLLPFFPHLSSLLQHHVRAGWMQPGNIVVWPWRWFNWKFLFHQTKPADCEGHLWSRKLENHLFLVSRGLFAGKLEMFGLHIAAAEGLVWVNHKNEPYWQ